MNRFAVTMTIIAAMFLTSVAFILFSLNVRPVEGSTIQGNDYLSTTTAPSTALGSNAPTVQLVIKKAAGSFGSMIVTGANTAGVTFYNATTSNISLRTGQKATTTILLAEVPPSLVAGTYVFDIAYSDGLLMVVNGSGVPTSTITYR